MVRCTLISGARSRYLRTSSSVLSLFSLIRCWAGLNFRVATRSLPNTTATPALRLRTLE